MDFTAFVTIMTTVLSVAVKVVGMPAQIKSNYLRKSTTGLSGWFMLTTLVSYMLWVVHGIQVHDMALVIGQGLGALVTAVIVTQMLTYRGTSQPRTVITRNSRPSLVWSSAMQALAARRRTEE